MFTISRVKTILTEKQKLYPSAFEVTFELNDKLDMKYLNKMNYILEKYNLEDKLEIFSISHKQYCGEGKRGKPKYLIEATYVIRCEGINNVAKKKMVNLLKKIPYLKKPLKFLPRAS